MIGAKSRGHDHLLNVCREARASVVYGHGRLTAELGEAPDCSLIRTGIQSRAPGNCH